MRMFVQHLITWLIARVGERAFEPVDDELNIAKVDLESRRPIARMHGTISLADLVKHAWAA